MSLCRRWRAWPGRASLLSTVATAQCPFTNRLFDALGDHVSDSVERLAKRAVFQDERVITESRRKLERFQSAPETLAERLAAQRSVRRFLIPSDVKVDKSKTYMEFTWPKEAIEAAAELERTATRGAAAEVHDGKTDAATSQVVDSSSEGATSTLTAASEKAAASPPWLRTRALAEYLRAYTPSTDGQYGTPHHPIYGRRGLTITDVYPIGNYALRISFSDGHTGGIYSYEYLYFLTAPGTKYMMMRAYLADLRRKRKSRDPPKRAPSKRRLASPVSGGPAADDDLGVGRRPSSSDKGEGGHLAPAFPAPPQPPQRG